MNTFSLALAGLNHKKLHTSLSLLAVIMGITLLTSAFLIANGLSEGLRNSGGKVDIVAGAKGSPLQLILSTIYHTDVPIGNIDADIVSELQKNPQIKKAVPIVVGDNFKGFRIIGTTPEFLDLYSAKPLEGKIFASPYEVIAGAAIPVQIGEEFAASHGFSTNAEDIHKDHLYKVVGKIEETGTAIDRLLITSLESVQELHDHGHHEDEHHNEKKENLQEHKDHEEHDDHDDSAREEENDPHHQITAVLIKTSNRTALINLPMAINKAEKIQAANPGYEMTRLSQNFGLGKKVMMALGGALLTLSMLMLFATLASSLADRRKDMAILRVMGASPSRLFAILMTEGILVAVTGAVIGLCLGHVVAWGLTDILGSFKGLIAPHSLLVLGTWDIGCLLIGGLCGAIAALPAAISAARSNIAPLLGKA